MGRQLFNDGPFVDIPITLPATYTTVTIAPLWPAAAFTPIFANDPKAGKIYCLRAGGTIVMSVNTATLILTPKYGTGGTALGPSTAQTLPVMAAGIWTIEADLVFTFIGAGAASKCYLVGKFSCPGTIATAGTGTTIPFGGTLTTVTSDALANLEINTTLGGTTGAPVLGTIYAYVFSRN